MASKKITRRAPDERLAESISKFGQSAQSELLDKPTTLIHFPNDIPAEMTPEQSPEIFNNNDTLKNGELLITELYAAPKDWNLWQPLSSNRLYELMESLFSVGLLHNIVVWQVPEELNDGRTGYMILSGHNRVDALKRLYETYQDPRFMSVRALIYSSDGINVATARRIIDDANLLKREDNPKEIAHAYIRRMSSLQSLEAYKHVSDRTLMEVIADQDKVSRSKILQYVQLKNCIDEIADLVGSVISLKAGVNIAQLDVEKQQYLYTQYYSNTENRHLFTNKSLLKLTPFHVTSTIDKIMKYDRDDERRVETIQVEVPTHLVNDFNVLVKNFLKKNT